MSMLHPGRAISLSTRYMTRRPWTFVQYSRMLPAVKGSNFAAMRHCVRGLSLLNGRPQSEWRLFFSALQGRDRVCNRCCMSTSNSISSTSGSSSKTNHGVVRKSTYRGVNWREDKEKWVARICVDGRYTHLGFFKDEETAARAYDRAATRRHKRPVFNFLEDGSLNPRRKACPVERRPQPAVQPKSTYRGVYWHKDLQKWRARVGHKYKHVSLGVFDTEEEAARAYDRRAKELLARPVLNWLPDGSLNPDRKRRCDRREEETLPR